MGILRLILFLIIIFYLFHLIGKILFPLFVSNKINNAQKRRQKEYEDYINHKKAEEGKVNFEYDNENRKRRNKDEGEYVDYEEIR